MASVSGQQIRFERIQLSDEFYSEGGTHGDYNGDGQGDVAIGPWIYWGPEFENKSQFYEGEAINPRGYSENFLMYSGDVDADGHLDILVLGFPGKESWWYQNPGENVASTLWPRHTILGSVDNESPLIADINGDGIDDLICSTAGQYGFASHAGQSPRDLWKFTAVSPNNGYQRFTHGLGIGDVDNDGQLDLMEKDGWWKNPGNTPDAALWQFHAFPFSSGGSQMYAVDLDGDGKNEVVTGLVAHGYGLVYYKATNRAATEFERVDIMTDDPATSPVGMAVSQLHALAVGDINRDGIPDLVTGKRWWAHANKDAGNSQPATLMWLQTQRQGDRVRFQPHVIDTSSGVGTQITLGDVNGDGLLDIVSGIKRGAYVFLQRPGSLPDAQSMVPGLAKLDSYGQRPALDSVKIDDPLGGFRPALSGRELNLGFESGDLTDWEVRGGMAAVVLAKNHPDSGNEPALGAGEYSADTGEQNKPIGELISRPFVLSHDWASFLLGGSGHAEARFELVSDETGAVLESAAGDGEPQWQRRRLDLSEWKGQLVRIRVVDHAEDGYVRFDDFRFHAK